jgi:uncharacterized membrane protein YesL
MNKKREFGDGPIYAITNYVMWFFLGNIYFMICIFPFIFVLLSFNQEFISEYLVLLTLSAIPIGPAYTALLSAMGKLVREKDVNITRDYFSAYKKSFLQSLFLWTFGLVIIIILIVDVRFFAARAAGRIVVPFLYAIAALILLSGLYMFTLVSRFYLKSIDIVKASFYLIISKWKVTISCVSVLIIAGFISTKFMAITTLFIFSMVCYAIMFLQKDVLKELEEKLSERKQVNN